MYKRNQVFMAACTALLFFGMMVLTLGSILPSLKATFQEKLSASALVALLPAGILLGSLVFGPIVDRYGYKLLLIISLLISALALLGLAYTRSLPLLYACIFIVGFGGGIINGGTSALVADISSENKGASLSLLSAFYGIGALGMPLLLGQLTGYLDYRQILAGIGFAMLIPLVWFWFVLFPVPKQQQGFPLQEGIRLLKEPALLLNALFLFFQSAVESLSNNWTTTYLQYRLDVTNKEALFALSFSVLGLTVGRLLLGSLLKQVSSYKILMASLWLVILGNVILMNSQSYPLSFVGVIFTGLGLAGGFPVILGYVGQLYASLSGTAFGIALVIALTGNTIINYLFGVIAENVGVVYLPVQIIACIVCMMIVLIIIKQRIKGKIKF